MWQFCLIVGKQTVWFILSLFENKITGMYKKITLNIYVLYSEQVICSGILRLRRKFCCKLLRLIIALYCGIVTINQRCDGLVVSAQDPWTVVKSSYSKRKHKVANVNKWCLHSLQNWISILNLGNKCWKLMIVQSVLAQQISSPCLKCAI